MPFKQVRKGVRVSNDEILGFAKLFNDELTLDNVSRFVFYYKLCYSGVFATCSRDCLHY